MLESSKNSLIDRLTGGLDFRILAHSMTIIRMTWLTVKPAFLLDAQQVFTGIQVTMEEKCHLETVLGT